MKSIIIKALSAFFSSEEGERLIGQIVIKAVNQALQRDVLWEDTKSEPGRTIEREKRQNILDHIAFYMPYVEGAIRGVQSDADQARNRSAQVCDILLEMGGNRTRTGQLLASREKEPLKIEQTGMPE